MHLAILSAYLANVCNHGDFEKQIEFHAFIVYDVLNDNQTHCEMLTKLRYRLDTPLLSVTQVKPQQKKLSFNRISKEIA